jgi:hypothetical protein
VDVLFGNEEDFSAMLGVQIEGVDKDFGELPVKGYEKMLHEVADAYPNLKVIASTLRTAHTASENAWGAIALHSGGIVHVAQRNVDILDRVGGGDSFASGLIYGLLADKGVEWAVKCGVAHGDDNTWRYEYRQPCRGSARHGRRGGPDFKIECERESEFAGFRQDSEGVGTNEDAANGGRNSLSYDDHRGTTGDISCQRSVSTWADRFDLCGSGPRCDWIGGANG